MQQFFTGPLTLFVRNRLLKVAETTVSAAVLCTAIGISDVTNKAGMGGKSIKYVMSLPLSAL